MVRGRRTSDRLVGRLQRSIVGVADQVLFSATNFALTIKVARYASPQEFGGFAILFATFLILLGANRGFYAEPLTIRYSRSRGHDWELAACSAVRGSAASGAMSAIVMQIVGLLVFGRVSQIAIAFSIAAPVLLVQDTLRYAAFSLRRPAGALQNDVSVAAIQFGLYALLIASGTPSSGAAVLGWGVAGLVGALVGFRSVRLHGVARRGHRERADRRLGSRLGMDNLVNQLAQQGVSYVVGAISGLAPAAALRAAQTAFTPPAVIIMGVVATATPDFVGIRRRSLREFRRQTIRLAVALAAGCWVYIAIAAQTPDVIGRGLLGASWNAARGLLIWVGIAQTGGALSSSAVMGLRAMSDTARTLRARGIVVSLNVIAIVCGTIADGARGGAIALAAAAFAQSAVWWTYFFSSYRDEVRKKARERLSDRWKALTADAAVKQRSDRDVDAFFHGEGSVYVGGPLPLASSTFIGDDSMGGNPDSETHPSGRESDEGF